jgi:sugar-specific transcriptional regulator TrmB
LNQAGVLCIACPKDALSEGCGKLSHERMLKTLVSLGLTEIDSEIYLLLAKEGPQKGRNMAEALNLYKQQLYRSLKRLQRKGMINATLEHPSRFCAVPIENIIDLLIKANLEEVQQMEENRKKILSFWKAMIKKELAR